MDVNGVLEHIALFDHIPYRVCIMCYLQHAGCSITYIISISIIHADWFLVNSQGGLYLNNEKVDDEGKAMAAEDVVDGKLLLLSAGKKNKLVVRMV